jgi:C4-dicarboxylate transporter, DctM subunit
VPILMMDELSSFALLTIPLFILLGAAIGASAAGKDIYESLHRWLDRVPGGLVIANILACGVFSAICGSSPATAAAIGKAGVPEMIKRGVPPSLATGSICAGGTLGILIPPSITMILYGLVDRDLDRPAVPRRRGAGAAADRAVLRLRLDLDAARAARRAADRSAALHAGAEDGGLGRVSPFIGIVDRHRLRDVRRPGHAVGSGGAVRVLALVLVIVIYRQWRLADQWRIFRETVRESSMILMIIGAAAVFSYMLSLLYVTQTAAQWLVDLDMNRWVLLGAINVFLLVAGCFLPPVAIILMVMPILTPVLEAANFDLIWFAVILTINMEVGLITPPVGLNLYVLKGVAPEVPLPTVLKGSLPFVLLMILAIVLIAVFPGIALWLPGR